MIEALLHLLGNGARLADLAKSFGWNAHGPNEEHAMGIFATQANEIWHAQDLIAAQIRSFGGVALPDFNDMDRDGIAAAAQYANPESGRAAKVLADAHRSAIFSFDAAIDLCAAFGFDETLTVIDERRKMHRHHRQSLLQLIG